MLFASPHAGLRLALRVVTGVGVGDSPVISTTSGAWLYDRKMPAMVLPSFAAESRKPKMPAELSAPSPDQRCSILPVAGSSVAMALLPATNSLKTIFPFGCLACHAAGAFLSFLYMFYSPPSLPLHN